MTTTERLEFFASNYLHCLGTNQYNVPMKGIHCMFPGGEQYINLASRKQEFFLFEQNNFIANVDPIRSSHIVGLTDTQKSHPDLH